MSIETAPQPASAFQLRHDPAPTPRVTAEPISGRLNAALCVLLASIFVLYAGTIDPDPSEARLGLAAGETIGPLGQAFGGWDPSLWPGRVIPTQLWARAEANRGSVGAIRWPAAIAAAVAGLIVCRRASTRLGRRAGLFTALAFFGSIAAIDRSATIGIEWIAGLSVVAALDRILGVGSDRVAGFWAAVAFVCGGWPPLVMILIAAIVVARQGGGLTKGLLIPPTLAFAAWSIWANRAAGPAAWAAALVLPIQESPDWRLLPALVLLGFPWIPFAALVASTSIRNGLSDSGRGIVLGWLQVAASATLVGTLMPGMGASARAAAFAGLAVAAGAVLDRLWIGAGGESARRWGRVAALAVCVLSALAIVPTSGYIAASIPYYRQISLLLAAAGFALALAAIDGAWHASTRTSLVCLIVLALLLKTAHAGIYAPERNYRLSQGPWGRAIGQWVPPNWPIHVFHAWPADLAFFTERPVRQLPDPKVLNFRLTKAGPNSSGNRPLFVLLHPEEFDHWPDGAPRIRKVRTLQDEWGRERILARTDGVVYIRKE